MPGGSDDDRNYPAPLGDDDAEKVNALDNMRKLYAQVDRLGKECKVTLTSSPEPSVDQLNAWFTVLHRVAQLQFDDPVGRVLAPSPLRQDIQDCVDRGWLMAWESAEKIDTGQTRLLIRPEGRAVYQKWCDMLAEAGTPVDPCWVRAWG